MFIKIFTESLLLRTRGGWSHFFRLRLRSRVGSITSFQFNYNYNYNYAFKFVNYITIILC